MKPKRSHSGTLLESMLIAKFPQKHVQSAIEHYGKMIDEFRKARWETSIAKAGKLVEAALKALWVNVGKTLPRAKDFKVDYVIRELERIPLAQADDTVRITIPRACRLVYEIASNRGARHDPDEVDPNVMDASVVVPVCGWVLAEMLRYAQKGMDPSDAHRVVLRLTQKTFPNIEEVDGRTYFHFDGLSARTVALLRLWHAHPDRVSQDDLVTDAQRHGFSLNNSRMGVSRLRRLVDDDGSGNWKLLHPGIEEAEKLISASSRTRPSDN